MNRRCAEECLQIPVASMAPHWQPVRSTKKIAFIALRSSTRGLWHPRGCFFPGGRSGFISSHSASGNLHPSSLIAAFPMRAPLVLGGGHVNDTSRIIQDFRAFCRGSPGIAYWDRL